MRFRFYVKNNDVSVFRVTAIESYNGSLYWSAREVFNAMVPSDDENSNDYLYRKSLKLLPGKPILKNITINTPTTVHEDDDYSRRDEKLRNNKSGVGRRNAHVLTYTQVQSMIKKILARHHHHPNVDKLIFFQNWFEKLHRGDIKLLVMKLYGGTYPPLSTPPTSIPIMTAAAAVQLRKFYNPYLICDLFCYENEVGMEYVKKFSFTLPYIIFSIKYRYWGNLLKKEKRRLTSSTITATITTTPTTTTTTTTTTPQLFG